MKFRLLLLLFSCTYFSTTLQQKFYSAVVYIRPTKILSQVPNQYRFGIARYYQGVSGDLCPSSRPQAELATDRLGLATYLS